MLGRGELEALRARLSGRGGVDPGVGRRREHLRVVALGAMPCACEICERAAIIEEGARLTRAEAVELAALRPSVTDVAIEAAGIAYGERPWWSVDGVVR